MFGTLGKKYIFFDAQTTYKNDDLFISTFKTIVNYFELTDEEIQEIMSIEDNCHVVKIHYYQQNCSKP